MELGSKSQNYYGDTIIYTELLPLVSESRALSVGITDTNVIGWVEVSIVKHWGVWWCYLTYESKIKCKNTNSNNDTKYLATDYAICRYSDSETDPFWTNYDWTYLDNPENMQYGFYEGIEWEVANANRGRVTLQGDTKYGFFPSVTDLECNVTFYDNLISGGMFTYTTLALN